MKHFKICERGSLAAWKMPHIYGWMENVFILASNNFSLRLFSVHPAAVSQVLSSLTAFC